MLIKFHPHTLIRCITFALVLISTAAVGSELKSSLFNEVDTAHEQAKQKSVNILAPISYSKAEKNYIKADKRYTAGGDLSKIKKLLENV
ncbi:MAG: hypothetical protein ACJAUP_003328 [Cellvibrionaceae bacterium]|jgi:hypothetical protein